MVNFLLFQQQQLTDGQSGGAWMQMLPLLAIVIVFYFFFIRPQMRKSKEQKKFREALKKGDKIITIGGIHGKIIEVQDTTFTIEVEGQVKLKIEKSAVAMDAASQIGAKP
jgi:preprotein translocase subunit YajC